MVFLNESNFFLENIDKLSYDILDIIYSYIPKSVTISLTKKNYIKEHYLLRNLINKRHIEPLI
jgi:hypothetical protein